MKILTKQKSDVPDLIGLPKEECFSGHTVTERIWSLWFSTLYISRIPKVLTLLWAFDPSQSQVSPLVQLHSGVAVLGVSLWELKITQILLAFAPYVSKEPERAELKHLLECTGMKQGYFMYIPRYWVYFSFEMVKWEKLVFIVGSRYFQRNALMLNIGRIFASAYSWLKLCSQNDLQSFQIFCNRFYIIWCCFSFSSWQFYLYAVRLCSYNLFYIVLFKSLLQLSSRTLLRQEWFKQCLDGNKSYFF